MAIQGMNHFNVLTNDVDATRRFYCGILGLTEGDRPPFSFDGLWLYADGRPILHVSAHDLPKERAGVIDHIAFTSTDLKGTVANLKAHGIKHLAGLLPRPDGRQGGARLRSDGGGALRGRP